MIRLIIILALIFSSIIISGCFDSSIHEEKCDIDREYIHTTINPINCSCPDGYNFKIISRGWGPCPNENMTDCPMSILKCVRD